MGDQTLYVSKEYEEEWEEARENAEEQGISLSEYVSRAVREKNRGDDSNGE